MDIKPELPAFSGVEGAPHGMLGRQESSLLYHLARDRYAGHGEIIDAGAFLGCSAYCLAKGLDENTRIKNKSGRIHCYDLFQLWTEPGVDDGAMSDFLRRTYGIETARHESTFHIFSANVGALARHIRIRQGDIRKESWSGRPIEILFIDICKTQSIWEHVLRTFYASLIPGISIVIHQDWHHTALPYIHVAQEYLGEYFEIIEPKASDSAAFRLVERIPDNVLETAAACAFSDHEQLALLDRTIERFKGHSRFLKLLKAELLRRQGRAYDALNLVEHTYTSHGEPMNPEEYQYFAGNVDGVAMAASRDLAKQTQPAGFDEGSYLSRHPDVAELIKRGVFKSGLHHYIRFNAENYLSMVSKKITS